MKRILVLVAMLFLIPYLSMSRPTLPQQTTAGGIRVEEAKLGKEVKDRQITNETAEFALNDKVYLCLKVTGAAGDSLVVTWKNGNHAYNRTLAIGGSPWRTWCYKAAALAGDWTVTIADSKGTVLKELSFRVSG